MFSLDIDLTRVECTLDIGSLGFGFGIFGGSQGVSVFSLSNGKAAIENKRQGGTTLGSF